MTVMNNDYYCYRLYYRSPRRVHRTINNNNIIYFIVLDAHYDSAYAARRSARANNNKPQRQRVHIIYRRHIPRWCELKLFSRDASRQILSRLPLPKQYTVRGV